MADKSKTVEFRRVFARIDNRELWIDGGKWQPLLDLLAESKGKADTLVIESPEVLGDTYREFVVNLTSISEAGLKVLIKPGAKKVIGRMSMGDVKAGTVEVDGAMSSPKAGKGILRLGRKPAVVLFSYAPDELYAQAELLVMLEKEAYKPSNEGRQIEGEYETGPGNLDEFFQEWLERPEDLKLLERKRLEIVEKGWDRLTYVTQKSHQNPEIPSRGSLNHRIVSKSFDFSGDDLLAEATEDLRQRIPKDGSFTCLPCMEKFDASSFDSIGLMGIEGMPDRPGKIKDLPYPICKKCAALPREKLFGMVEGSVHAYGKLVTKEWERVDKAKLAVDDAIKTLEDMFDGDGPIPRIPEGMDGPGLVDTAMRMKSLSEKIHIDGHFICMCCMQKKNAKNLDSIGSSPLKDKSGNVQKPLVYPLCVKCAKRSPDDVNEMAEKNMKAGKA